MAIVLGIVMVSVLPSFHARWKRVQEERAAFAVAQSLRSARSVAVSRSQVMAWVLEAESRRTWIGQEQDDGSVSPMSGSLGAPRRLPEAVTVQAWRDREPVDRVIFFPDGTAQATALSVGGDSAESHYQIAVDAATGDVTVTSTLLPSAS